MSHGLPPGETIVDWLDGHAETRPDAPFLAEGDTRWSYGGFRALVARVAGCLAAHGVGRGDRVVLYLGRKSAHVAAYLATASLGAIAVHVYPQRPRAYVDFAARAVGARHVFTLDPWKPADDAYAVLGYPADPSAFEPVATRPSHPVAYLMFTSGTTSTPKAVVTAWQNVRAVTENLIRIADMRPGDREVIFMPLGSTGGAGHLHTVLALGNAIRLLPWFIGDLTDDDLAGLVETIEADRIDGFLATPAIITRLLSTHRAGWLRAGRRLRYLLANVTPMRQSVVVDLLASLPDLRFVTYYGLTEASRSVVNVCRDAPGAEHATGRPSKGVEVWLREPDGAGVGEVMLRGPNVCPGYWGEAPEDRQGGFATGDLGRFDDDGRLWVLGRMGDMINVDGLKLLPSEVEEVVRTHPAVAECAAVGLPDPTTWQRLALAVVLRAPEPDAARRAALAADLRALVGRHLAAFKVPREVVVVDALPRSGIGKLQRRALIDLFEVEAEPAR